MKKLKLLPLALAGVLSIGITSCKKDRTCECTETYPQGGGAFTANVTLIKVTKRQAKDICVSRTDYDNNGQITSTTDCKLK